MITAVTLLCGADPSGPRGGPGRSAPHVTGQGRPGRLAPQRVTTRIETTTVEFAALTNEDVDWYVSTGEPDDKAGAYAIQGLASRFIASVSGSYSNVVGLPVSLVQEMLQAAGFRP